MQGDKERPMEANKTSNGMKIGVAAIVVAMFAACFTMISMSVKPVTIHQEVLRKDLDRIEDQSKEALRDHVGLAAHTGAQKDLTTVKERFKEVETQFAGERRVMALHVEALTQRIEKLEDKLENHNALREKIRHLERTVYGK